MALAAELEASANLDLDGVVGQLGVRIAGADLGEVRFDPGAVLALVERASPVDLGAVGDAVERLRVALRARVEVGLPEVAAPPGGVEAALSGPLIPDVTLDPSAGIDGLAMRIAAVRAELGEGSLATLLGLLPGPRLPDTFTRVGGVLGGLIELARVLGGLTATATVTERLVARTGALAGRLDVATARAVAAELAMTSADTSLVIALRMADPGDAGAVEELGGRVVAFLDTVLAVADGWSTGMGFGEATLLGVDLAGSAGALEAARLAVAGADVTAVAVTVTQIRQLLAPILDLPLPDPVGAAGGAVGSGLGLVDELTAAVRAWNPASVAGPVRTLGEAALAPLEEVRRAAEVVAGAAASAVRTVRQIVAEVDVAGVADAVRTALAPVVDLLDAVEDAIGSASATLTRVARDVEGELTEVAAAVAAAAGTVRAGLGRVRGALADLHLDTLARDLGSALHRAAAQLAAARLDPYFDAAIDVIDTGASVIAAVPFGLLPTDVQQEIVDVSRPIKRLDLQEVEDTLRAELATIRDTFHTDVLAQVEAAYADVVAFLVSLDPAPVLQELEDGPLAQLRAAVAAVDPVALLAPATDALARLRGLLDGVDLRATVLDPLDAALAPLRDALAAIRPAELLAGATAEVAAIRERLAALLPVDTVTAAVHDVAAQVADVLEKADPAALAGVLLRAAPIVDRPPGPPGGPFGSLLVTLAQATGLDAVEEAVDDTLAWVRGRADAGEQVRAQLALVASRLVGVRADVAALDPVPLTAAAQAQHRALLTAVRTHPAGSALRAALEPLLLGTVPGAALGPLAENRRRYLAALDVDVALSATMAATGRSDLTRAAADLRAALAPLDVVPARIRALMRALDVEHFDAPASELVTHLLDTAGPSRVLPRLTELATAVRDQLVRAVRALPEPVLDAVAGLTGVLDALDLTPIVEELEALHAEVTADVAALSPAALLGGPVAAFEQLRTRLADFDPLAPVREVIDAATRAATQVLDTARPTVVFAPVVALHADIVAAAVGLDVATLLRPVLEGLDAVAAQLDGGFDRTGDALARLQAALPDSVSDSPLGVSVSASLSLEGGL